MRIVFTKQHGIKIGLALLLFIICAVVAFLVFSYTSFQRISVTSKSTTPTPTATPKPHLDEFNQLEPYSLLMMGYGGGGHDGGKLTDSLMLIHIVPEKQKIFLISLPRDLWVELPVVEGSPSYWKINAAYPIGSDDRTYPKKPVQFTGEAGGGELAKYAVTSVTGLPVTHFAALDFAGFVKTVNILRGIDVEVERTFTDDLYPVEEKKTESCGYSEEDIAAITATMSAAQIEKERVFGCRYETIHFDAGTVHMDGETALKFVRSRHAKEDGGDFNRAARQRNVLLAVKAKVFSLSFFSKVIPFINTLSYNLQMDMPIDTMEEFLQYKDDLSTYKIVGISLTDRDVLTLTTRGNGQSVLVAREGDGWQSVHDWIKREMEK